MIRRVIIKGGRFWWLYPETGRTVRIYANDRLRSQISQFASTEARMAKEEAPPRRTNHPPRPPGTMPTLPAANRNIGDKTLTELAHDFGWGSVYRFTDSIRKHRRAIYETARDNGRKRVNAKLMASTYEAQP
jgi:hypothetical protein